MAPRLIATAPYKTPIMLYLPRHGGWYRGIVQLPSIDGREGILRSLVTLSGSIGAQVDRHVSLNTAFVTHWDDLAPSPLTAEETDAFVGMTEYCVNNKISMFNTESSLLFVKKNRTSLRVNSFDYVLARQRLMEWAIAEEAGQG